MAAFLRLNGIVVPVAAGTAGTAQDLDGKLRRSANYRAVRPGRSFKGHWKFSIPLLSKYSDALAWRDLVAGRGHSMSFDNGSWYTSKGMAPVSIGASWGFSTSGARFGTKCASSGSDNSVWAFVVAGSPLTLAWYLNANGAGYHHYVYSTDGVTAGKGWIDGVGGFVFADMLGLVSISGGLITFGLGSGTNKWDDIVALPSQAPDAWPPQMYARGHVDSAPFSSLPALDADGLYIDNNRACSVMGGDVADGKLTHVGSASNLHEFSFELEEQ